MTKRGMRVAALCAVLMLAGAAQADSITFVMDDVFHGTATPSGSPTVTIDDEGTPGDVKFTFSAIGLSSSSEFISKWFFNTAIDLSAVGTISGFTQITGTTAAPSLAKSFNATTGQFKADSDGYYDWVFDFTTSGAGGGANRFGDGDSFSFYYTYAGITAGAFDVLSLMAPDSIAGPFESAIHLQGIIVGTGTDSVWMSNEWYEDPEDPEYPEDPEDPENPTTVPEPGFALLAILGIVGVVARRRA